MKKPLLITAVIFILTAIVLAIVIVWMARSRQETEREAPSDLLSRYDYVQMQDSEGASGNSITDGDDRQLESVSVNDELPDEVTLLDSSDEGFRQTWVFAADMFQEIKPGTLEEAQYMINDYNDPYTGTLSEWDEDDKWYVRKISSFVNQEGLIMTAYVFYTFLPKENNNDTCAYMGYYVHSDEHPLSQKQYEDFVSTLKECVGNDERLNAGYDEAMSELEDIITYRSASKMDLSPGMRQLHDAQIAAQEELKKQAEEEERIERELMQQEAERDDAEEDHDDEDIGSIEDDIMASENAPQDKADTAP